MCEYKTIHLRHLQQSAPWFPFTVQWPAITHTDIHVHAPRHTHIHTNKPPRWDRRKIAMGVVTSLVKDQKGVQTLAHRKENIYNNHNISFWKGRLPSPPPNKPKTLWQIWPPGGGGLWGKVDKSPASPEEPRSRRSVNPINARVQTFKEEKTKTNSKQWLNCVSVGGSEGGRCLFLFFHLCIGAPPPRSGTRSARLLVENRRLDRERWLEIVPWLFLPLLFLARAALVKDPNRERTERRQRQTRKRRVSEDRWSSGEVHGVLCVVVDLNRLCQSLRVAAVALTRHVAPLGAGRKEADTQRVRTDFTLKRLLCFLITCNWTHHGASTSSNSPDSWFFWNLMCSRTER